MTRAVPQSCLDFLQDMEACVLHVYDDAQPTHVLAPGDKVLGTLTAGWGHTGNLNIGMDVALSTAQAWLADDASIAAAKLAAVVDQEVIDGLTEHQYGALVSFTFNLGANPKWTIWKRLNAKQYDQVPGELMKFTNQCIDGKMVKVQGLVNRRASEVAFWSTEEPGSITAITPSSVTRKTQTPPTPSDPVPASKSKALIVSAVGVATGAVPMLDQVRDTITPYAEHSHYVHVALSGLAAVAALCAGTGIFYMWVQKQNARN